MELKKESIKNVLEIVSFQNNNVQVHSPMTFKNQDDNKNQVSQMPPQISLINNKEENNNHAQFDEKNGMP